MAQEKIVWTVLPYGRVTEGELAGRLRCSIVVSPQLTPASAAENALSAFPHFLDWPARLAQASFALTAGPATLPLTRLGKVDKDPWSQIFHADTPVTDFAFTDMSAVNLRSYSVRNVLRFIKTSYGQLAATSGNQLPTLLPYPGGTPALRDMLVGLGTAPERDRGGGFDRLLGGGVEKLLGATVFGPHGQAVTGAVVGIDGKPLARPQPLRALPPDRGALPASVAGQFRTAAEYDFYQANRFYGRPENALTPERRPKFEASPQAGRVKPALVEPALDFHRIIAAFADLPGLMRLLGLVIDVALPDRNPLLDALAASGAASHAEGAIGLAVSWPAPAAPDADAYPTTAYALSSSRFVTRARSSDVGDGQLQLQGAGDLPDKVASDFDVYQVDPDGTALKTVGFVLSAQRLINRPVTERAEVTYTTGDEQGVAALRSGGLGVSRHGRAQRVAADMAAAALKHQALAASPADSRKVALFAEDVQRGYRVDVLDDKDGQWRSLCMRRGDYTLVRAGQPLALPPDEGYVKGASTTSGDSPDDHYLHESMFRWTGWSLVAPRPGRTIRSRTADGTGLQSEEVVDVTDQADKGTGVVAKFRALPGSLPRLRFGRRYRMRARVVDSRRQQPRRQGRRRPARERSGGVSPVRAGRPAGAGPARAAVRGRVDRAPGDPQRLRPRRPGLQQQGRDAVRPREGRRGVRLHGDQRAPRRAAQGEPAARRDPRHAGRGARRRPRRDREDVQDLGPRGRHAVRRPAGLRRPADHAARDAGRPDHGAAAQAAVARGADRRAAGRRPVRDPRRGGAAHAVPAGPGGGRHRAAPRARRAHHRHAGAGHPHRLGARHRGARAADRSRRRVAGPARPAHRAGRARRGDERGLPAEPDRRAAEVGSGRARAPDLPAEGPDRAPAVRELRRRPRHRPVRHPELRAERGAGQGDRAAGHARRQLPDHAVPAAHAGPRHPAPGVRAGVPDAGPRARARRELRRPPRPRPHARPEHRQVRGAGAVDRVDRRPGAGRSPAGGRQRAARRAAAAGELREPVLDRGLRRPRGQGPGQPPRVRRHQISG